MRRNWPREGRQPVRDAGGPVWEASPAPGGTGASLTGPTQFRAQKLRTQFLRAKVGELRSLSEPTKIRALTREGRWGGASLPEGGVSDLTREGRWGGASLPEGGVSDPLTGTPRRGPVRGAGDP